MREGPMAKKLREETENMEVLAFSKSKQDSLIT